MRHQKDSAPAAPNWDDKAWYRSSQWNDEIAADFEVRLKRARMRAEYLRVQAAHLLDKPDAYRRSIGRQLLERMVRDYADSDPMTVKYGSEMLADAYKANREWDKAEAAYRDHLRLVEESPSGFSGTTYLGGLSLAELLIFRGGRNRLDEAEKLLASVEAHVLETAMFKDRLLRLLVAKARLAVKNRDSRAGLYARLATQTANDLTPSMPRHPTMGIPRADNKLRSELARIERRFGRRWDRDVARYGDEPNLEA